MGIIKALVGSTNGVLADQWKEFFVCDSLSEEILMVKGHRVINNNSSNIHGNDDIITDGSIISVAEGQGIVMVDGGKVIGAYTEPGEYVYRTDNSPTVFEKSGLGKSIKDIGRRFTFGGVAPNASQRIYYVNTKEIMGNTFDAPKGIAFRVVDENVGLDMDCKIACRGIYSYHIVDPGTFYKKVAGNVVGEFTRSKIASQMKSEINTILQSSVAIVSDKNVRPSDIPSFIPEIIDKIKQQLSEELLERRGIEICSFSIDSITPEKVDFEMIRELQRNAVFRDPTMAAAQLVGAQSDAMKTAASNGGYVGMAAMGSVLSGMQGSNDNMYNENNKYSNLNTNNGNVNTSNRVLGHLWRCKCGTLNTGNFCENCGNSS